MHPVVDSLHTADWEPLVAGGAISDTGRIVWTGPIEDEAVEPAPPVKTEPDTRQVRFAEACEISPLEDLASALGTHKKRETVADQRKRKAQRVKNLKRALCAYESFFRMTPGIATVKNLESSSARVAGGSRLQMRLIGSNYSTRGIIKLGRKNVNESCDVATC